MHSNNNRGVLIMELLFISKLLMVKSLADRYLRNCYYRFVQKFSQLILA